MAEDATRIATEARDRVRFEEEALALADQVYRVRPGAYFLSAFVATPDPGEGAECATRIVRSALWDRAGRLSAQTLARVLIAPRRAATAAAEL